METPNTYCKNCGTPITGAYCHHCGQRAMIHKVTFRETFNDLVSGMFSFEAPFWKTMGLLFKNPGLLFREYLAGRRKTYFKPVSFFILLTALHIVIRSLLNYDPMAGIPNEPEANVNVFREAGQFMVQNINNILFIFVFTLSLFTKLFFYRHHTWAEYIAIAFYLVGMYIFLGTLNLFPLVFLNTEMQFLTMAVMCLYFIYTMVSFFQEKKLLVTIKSLLAYVFGTLFYVVLGFGFALLIVYLT